MDVLVTCKYEEDRSKMKALEWPQHYTASFQTRIWPKFELIQAFMHVLVTCKNEDDCFKNEGARVFTRFLPL